MALLEESQKLGTEVNRRKTENYAAPLNNPASLNLSIKVKRLEK
jgi:hypothetical protein